MQERNTHDTSEDATEEHRQDDHARDDVTAEPLRKDFFSRRLPRVSPRHARTETTRRETAGRERDRSESDRPADPLSSLEHSYYYYCYVPERYVSTSRLTRPCQPGTPALTGWSA